MTKTGNRARLIAPQPLTKAHEDAYRRLAAREHVRPEDAPLLESLQEHHLIEHDPHSPETPLVLDPRLAERQKLAEVHSEITTKLKELTQLAGTYGRLEGVYAQQRSSEGGVRVLESRERVNAAIGQAMSRVSTALYTAQPSQRTPEIIDASKKRDGTLLQRGVQMYTIYPQSARSRELESQWAEYMSARGAEIRTSPVPFPRIILVDGVAAYVEEPLPEGADPDPQLPRPAIEIAHPALMMWVKSIYMYYWLLAQPWQGGRQRETRNNMLTSPRQRTILRLLENEASRAQIARYLHVSERVISSELKTLREKFNVDTEFGLAMRWRAHPEYSLP